MSELRMRAYYYSFEKTGTVSVDKVLSQVACAGKGYHHTQDWSVPLEWSDEGKSYVDMIQDAAADVSMEITALKQREARLVGALREIARQSINAEEFEANGGDNYEETDHRYGYEWAVERSRQVLKELGVE